MSNDQQCEWTLHMIVDILNKVLQEATHQKSLISDPSQKFHYRAILVGVTVLEICLNNDEYVRIPPTK